MRWDPLQRMFLVYNGGGGDPPPMTSTTSTIQQYSPEEAARRAKLMAEAEQIYGRTAGAASGMPGPMPSAQTLQAQQMMQQQATGGMQDVANLMPWAMNFGIKQVTDPMSSPGFQQALGTATRKVGEAYTGPTGPFANIRSGFTAGTSGGSGTREGIAMGMAGRDYLNTIGDVTGRMTSDAYTQGLNTFSNTLRAAPIATSTMGAPAGAMAQVGAGVEAQEEAQRNWQLQAPWANIAPYASIVGQPSPIGQTSTQTQPGARANPAAPLGSAFMGGSLAAMMGINPLVGAGAGLALALFS